METPGFGGLRIQAFATSGARGRAGGAFSAHGCSSAPPTGSSWRDPSSARPPRAQARRPTRPRAPVAPARPAACPGCSDGRAQALRSSARRAVPLFAHGARLTCSPRPFPRGQGFWSPRHGRSRPAHAQNCIPPALSKRCTVRRLYGAGARRTRADLVEVLSQGILRSRGALGGPAPAGTRRRTCPSGPASGGGGTAGDECGTRRSGSAALAG